MKKIISCLFAISVFIDGAAQSKQHDSVAILIVDRMADVISSMESCSFKLNTANDVRDSLSTLVKQFADYEVYMNGPDKMLINAHGQKGHRELWYNGEELAYYFYDENNYGVMQAPGTIMEMIDSLNAQYDIEFPAADFFYPAFTDDLLENADTIRYLGLTKMGGKEYFHILACGKEVIFQFWISNDAYNLPAKFAVTYKHKEGHPQYIASFSDWQVNPQLPDAMFDFLPPPKATRVRMLAKNEK